MSAADVAYVVHGKKQTGITLNLAFNRDRRLHGTQRRRRVERQLHWVGEGRWGTFTDPGQVVDASYPNDKL